MNKFIIICIILCVIILLILYKDKTDVNNNLEKNIDIYGNGSIYIPKKIHQIITDKNNIPGIIQKNINHLKKLNPGWSYFLYDYVDIINYIKANCDPDILRAYNMINPEYGAARADFFRYIIMYQQGGVYLDIKSSAKVPFDFIIKKDDEFILNHWFLNTLKKDKIILNSYIINFYNKYFNYEDGEFQQWNIICMPFHPFLKAVIDNCIKNIYNYDYGYGRSAVFKITGPIVYTQTITPLLPYYKHTIYDRHEYIGLQFSIYWFLNHMFVGKKHYSQLKTPLIIKN
jgi:mannosyltransferase OCH1-like enzyme